MDKKRIITIAILWTVIIFAAIFLGPAFRVGIAIGLVVAGLMIIFLGLFKSKNARAAILSVIIGIVVIGIGILIILTFR